MLHLPFVFVRQEAEVAAYGLEIAVGAGHVGFRGIRFDPAQAVLQPSHEGRDVSHIVYPTRDAAFHHEAGFHLSIADTEHWYPRHVRHARLNADLLPDVAITDDKVGRLAGIGAEGKNWLRARLSNQKSERSELRFEWLAAGAGRRMPAEYWQQ